MGFRAYLERRGSVERSKHIENLYGRGRAIHVYELHNAPRWFKSICPEHPAVRVMMLCTVQCRPAAACARKRSPRVHSKETTQEKRFHDWSLNHCDATTTYYRDGTTSTYKLNGPLSELLRRKGASVSSFPRSSPSQHPFLFFGNVHLKVEILCCSNFVCRQVLSFPFRSHIFPALKHFFFSSNPTR